MLAAPVGPLVQLRLTFSTLMSDGLSVRSNFQVPFFILVNTLAANFSQLRLNITG
jgi:hypothetical protein